MADENRIGEAYVEVRATVSKLRSDMRDSERAVRQGLDGMQRQAGRTRDAMGRVGASFRREMNSSAAAVRGLNSQLGATVGLVGSVGGAFVAQQIARMADEYTMLGARIRTVTRDGEDFRDIQEEIFNISQRLRAPLNEMVGLYVRIRQATGAADVEARQMVESLAMTLAISGANQAEQASFLTQIGQALGEGYLRAEELNTVLSTNPRYVRMLADYLGVASTEIRRLAREGQITSDVLRGAAIDGAGRLAEEFADMPLTITGATQQLQNAMVRYVGETDSGLGASRRLAEGLSLLANNFQSVADAILLVGAAGATVMGGRALERGIWIASREVRALDAPYRAERFGLMRERQRALDRASEYDAASEGRERRIRRLQEIARLRRERINAIRQRAADRMFGSDGMAIEQSIRTGRPPVLRDQSRTAGPIRIGQGRSEAENLAREQDRLARAERELQRVRGEGHSAAVRNLQVHNRLAWITRELADRNGLLAASQRLVQASAVGVGRVFGSLWNFLGGPWGVALTAAIGLWALFRNEQEKAAIGMQRMESALALIASAAPPASDATEDAADQAERLGDAAVGARNLAEAEGLASRAAASLAENQEEAARATDLRARAQRGLAAAQERSARATLQEALAESRRLQRSLPGQISNMESGIPALEARIETAQNYPIDPSGARDGVVASLRQRLADRRQLISDTRSILDAARRDEPLFRDALNALNEGFEFGGASATPSGADVSSSITTNRLSGGGDRRGDDISTLRMQAELSLARLRNDQERVATLEDAMEVERRTHAYIEAGMNAERARALAVREVSAERIEIIRQQEESLELSELQFRADMERSRGNVLTAEALEDEIELRQVIADLVLDGLSHEEAARVAGERQNEARANREARRARELAIMRLEFLREIAIAEGNATRAAQIGNQIEVIRRGGELQEVGAVGSEEEGRKRAAAEVSERARAQIRGQVRDAVEEAMWQAMTRGDWRQALADSLNDAAREGFSRAMDYLFDAIDAAMRQSSSGGGGGGFWGSLFSAGAGAFTGGGATKAPSFTGSSAPAAPSFDDDGARSGAMRSAIAAAGEPRPVAIEVKARTDGSVYLEIQAAEQRATLAGGRAGAEAVSKMLKQRSSI